MLYFYDFEVYKNFFCATFISKETSQTAIDRYIHYDILGDKEGKCEALREFKYEQYIISDIEDYKINDFQRLGIFVESAKSMVLVGYNNSKYDDIILDYIFYNRYRFGTLTAGKITAKLYDLSQSIIGINFNSSYQVRKILGIKHTYKYTSIDLMKLNYLDKQRISLKQVSIALKWHKIQDYVMPYPYEFELEDYADLTLDQLAKINSFERYVHTHHVQDILSYNVNDTLITHKLYYTKFNELQLRLDLDELYKTNTITLSRSSVADVLLAKFYSEYTGLDYWAFSKQRTDDEPIKISDIYNPRLQFDNSVKCDVLIGYKIGDQKDYKFKSFLTQVTLSYFMKVLGERVITMTDELAYKVIINGTGYKLMSGGIHSIDDPRRFKADEQYTLLDADVNSYYPSMVVQYRIKPRHLSDAFISIADMVVTNRLEIKSRLGTPSETKQDKTASEGLKIVANAGFFGKFGADGWLRDLKALLAVTINGELNLLMLVEKLESAGFHVISANTDGLVTRVDRDRIGLYYTLCNDWEKATRLSLEFTEYKDYCRTTVNDYYSITIKDKLKTKGDFSNSIDIAKSFMHPIVPWAVREYFINNIPIETTLRNHKDIYDFCMSIKTGSDYTNELHSIEGSNLKITKLQKNIRYYVSTRGGTLFKRKKDNNSLSNLVKDYSVTIFNDFIPKDDISEYNINYNYYKMKCMNIIDKTLGNLTKDIIKMGGSLFD